MTSKGRSQFNTSIDDDILNRFKVRKSEKEGIFHKGYSDVIEKLMLYWLAVDGHIGKCLMCLSHTHDPEEKQELTNPTVKEVKEKAAINHSNNSLTSIVLSKDGNDNDKTDYDESLLHEWLLKKGIDLKNPRVS